MFGVAPPEDLTVPSWHTMTPERVLRELKSDHSKGLSRDEAFSRRKLLGPGSFHPAPFHQACQAVLKLFINPVSWLWVVTAVMLPFWGRLIESLTIAALLVIRILVVFVEEYKAGRAFDDLCKMTEPVVHVLRDELIVKLRADELVPGDIIFLESEDVVPADARLLETNRLEIKEAILTGEPLPVKKQTECLEDHEIPVSKRSNMVYMGSVVIKGKGVGCVTAVGPATEPGKFHCRSHASKIQEMPLYRRLKTRGLLLYYILFPLCVSAVLWKYFYLGEQLPFKEAAVDLMLDCTLLATAALPWGLLPLITIVTALGMKRMAVRRAVLRSPASVEKIASVSAICSSKQGVLTTGRMKVRNILADGEIFRIDDSSSTPLVFIEGNGETNDQPVSLGEKQSLLNLMKAVILCTSAELEESTGGRWSILGDSTEGALLTLGASLGFSKKELLRGFLKIEELPFDPVRKRMTVLYKNPSGKLIAFSKGAPENILGACQKRLSAALVQPFGLGDKEQVLACSSSAGGEALRVLAFAYRELDSVSSELDLDEVERNLVFLGLISLEDPPRERVKDAVEECLNAGVELIMVSGDQKTTAARVGSDLGILREGDLVLSGDDVDRLSEEELIEKIGFARVFARVTPAHKLRIIHSLKASGHRVAITGENLTDVPSFTEADASIAMGLRGSDVVRKAGDLTLTDDSFATLVAAMEEARVILTNIASAIHFVLITHLGELMLLLLTGLLGMRYGRLPLPMTFTQIMLVNVVILSLPAVVIGIDPGGTVDLKSIRRKDKKGLLPAIPMIDFLTRGIFLAVVTLASYGIGFRWAAMLGGGDALALGRTMAMSTLVFCQLGYALNGNQFSRAPVLSRLFKNKFLLPGVLFSLLVFILVLYIPRLSAVFQTVQLGYKSLAVVIVLPLLYHLPFGIQWRQRQGSR